MTTFDTSTSEAQGSTPAAPAGPPVAVAYDPAADRPESLLDQLRARVAERDEEESDPWVKEIPMVGIRLVCDPDIESGDYQRWVKSSQTKSKGVRRRGPTALDLDQFALSVRALVATNLRLEIRSGDDWRPMTGTGGVELTLESTELLRAFNVMDTPSLLRKLFGRDARVIDAGQELLSAAGYLDDGDDDENP